VSDPLLQEMDWLLDDPPLVKLVRLDLAKHYAKGTLGRHPVPVEVTLRLTVLRRYKRWPYRQAQQEVQDSAVYQGWVRIYDQPVPHYGTLNDLERLIRAQTLHRMNDRLMQLAQDYRMSQGYRLRVDSSVTESNIHHPTDSSLLGDGTRVLTRTMKKIESKSGGLKRKVRDRMRSIRKRVLAIALSTRLLGPPGEERRKRQYRELLSLTRKVMNQAQRVLAEVKQSPRRRRTPVEGLAQSLPGDRRRRDLHRCRGARRQRSPAARCRGVGRGFGARA